MSVVVGIREKGVVYLGADSQSTCGWSSITAANESNFKISKLLGLEGCLIGGVGDVREMNLIFHAKNIVEELAVYKNEVDFGYVVNKVVPNMFNALKPTNIDGKAPVKMNSTFLLALGDRMYVIYGNGAALEINDYFAIGSGQELAMGSLYNTSNTKQNPNTRIVSAIKAAANTNIYVDYPLVLCNTKENKFKIIKEQV